MIDARGRRLLKSVFVRFSVSLLACWFAFEVHAAEEPRGFDTVVVDAGHGGIDRGGVPGQRGIAEKIVTLDTAQRLQRLLRGRGLRVIMTRTDDTFISLSERVAATAAGGRAVFLSIHYNSAPREEAHGIETYYYRADSFGLATRLHRQLVGSLGTEDRFVRRRGFFVIRLAHVPAVLCECGFLTNIEEENRIEGSGYRQKIAEALAKGLLAQRSEGNPDELGGQPPVTTEHLGGRSPGRSRHGRAAHHAHAGKRGGTASRSKHHHHH